MDAGSRGSAWIAPGIVFLTLGISRPSGAFIGLGAAFLVIGLRRRSLKRRSGSSM